MGHCVAKIDTSDANGKWIKIPCGNETEVGYKYCEEHKTRKWAIKEREEKALGNVVDASAVFNGGEVDEVDAPGREIEREQTATHKEAAIPSDQKNIYEKTAEAFNRVIAHEEWTAELLATLSHDELRYQDKAGAEQVHSYLPLHERAMDRVLRFSTAIAKLNIDAQSVNVNKMVRETIKICVGKALERYGMNQSEIQQVRSLLAEEFDKLGDTG